MSSVESITLKIDKSSDIKQINYNIETKTLLITFHSANYLYSDVELGVVLGFLATDSIGKYFNEEIKKKNYKYTKVEDEVKNIAV